MASLPCTPFPGLSPISLAHPVQCGLLWISRASEGAWSQRAGAGTVSMPHSVEQDEAEVEVEVEAESAKRWSRGVGGTGVGGGRERGVE